MVLPITNQRWNIKPLDVGSPILAISVDHIIYSTLVIADPASYVYDLFANEGFIGHLGNEVPSISQEDNHIIEVRDFADKFVFLQTCADETTLTIYIELFIFQHHLGDLNLIKALDLGEAGIFIALLFE
ncbi:unknown [Porphyromonas sp. CAG:1061]|nr:unknown [Porphyromonas sp. CAG:1061]